jgi:hypothetical protein
MTVREVRCIESDCGTLNRVPAHSITKIARCGKCHAALPELSAIKVLQNVYRFRGRIAIGICAVFLLWASNDAIRARINNSVTSPPACQAHTQPRQGVFAYYDLAPAVARLTIRTAADANYFVKLEHLQSGAPSMTFFIRGNSTLEAKVPLGDYIIKYASGDLWCDESDLFGPGTTIKQADDIFTFAEDEEGISHWTIELIKQRGGNLGTRSIPRSKF